jgi:hypothetical protein
MAWTPARAWGAPAALWACRACPGGSAPARPPHLACGVALPPARPHQVSPGAIAAAAAQHFPRTSPMGAGLPERIATASLTHARCMLWSTPRPPCCAAACARSALGAPASAAAPPGTAALTPATPTVRAARLACNFTAVLLRAGVAATAARALLWAAATPGCRADLGQLPRCPVGGLLGPAQGGPHTPYLQVSRHTRASRYATQSTLVCARAPPNRLPRWRTRLTTSEWHHISQPCRRGGRPATTGRQG